MSKNDKEVVRKNDFIRLVHLIQDLDWERDRMTSDGRQTLEYIWDIINNYTDIVREDYYQTLKEQMFKAIN